MLSGEHAADAAAAFDRVARHTRVGALNGPHNADGVQAFVAHEHGGQDEGLPEHASPMKTTGTVCSAMVIHCDLFNVSD